jgi:hypothetical protein
MMMILPYWEIGATKIAHSYLVANLPIHRNLHCNHLAVKSSVQDSSKVPETALLAHQPWEIDHFVRGRGVFAVSDGFIGVHFWGGGLYPDTLMELACGGQWVDGAVCDSS